MFKLSLRYVITSALVLLLTATTWCDAVSSVAGISGGTLKSRGNMSIAIPDSFEVTRVSYSAAGVFVVAGNDRIDASGRTHFLSELWLFPTRNPPGPAETFADRRVLLSINSRSGEGKQLITRLVTGPYATAVQINGLGSAHTVLFDNTGTQIEIPWKTIAGACDCAPGYVNPLTWLALGDERRDDWHLLCHVSEEGGKGPFVMLYKLVDGTITVMSPEEALGDLGDALMRFYYWDY